MPSNTPAPTRRRLIQSAALLGVSALAGCGGESTATSTASAGPDGDPPEDALTDPAHVRLRNPDKAQIVRDPESESDESDAAEGTPRFDRWRHVLVDDAERAAELTFAEVDGVDEARQFLTETDFSSETVYIEERTIEECYEQRLCWIRWTASRIETDYARILADADFACEADAEDVVSTLIRIPAALSADQVSRYGSGSGGRCRSGAEMSAGGES